MKKWVRFCSMVLAVVFILSVSMIPASAAGIAYQNRFRAFRMVSIADSGFSTGYTKALQRFLQCFNAEYAVYLQNNGGIDGYFGPAVETLVKSYQPLKGLTADGVVGPDTWAEIAEDLEVASVNNAQTILSENGSPVIRILNNQDGTYSYLYYTWSGGSGARFHTDS